MSIIPILVLAFNRADYLAEITKAIKQMMCNYELFKSKAEEHGRLFAWEAQMPIFKKLFRKR